MGEMRETWADTPIFTTNLTNYTNFAWVEHSILTSEKTEIG